MAKRVITPFDEISDDDEVLASGNGNGIVVPGDGRKIVLPDGPLGPWLPRRAEFMTVMPDQANQVLLHFDNDNRGFKFPSIGKVKSALLNGRWKLNGESVIFSWTPNLMDGQNRFKGCVEAGVPMETLVVFGMDPDAFDTIDRGTNRSQGDDLAVLGEVNCNALAAAHNLVFGYNNGLRSVSIMGPNGPSYILREAFLGYEEEFRQGLRDSVSFFVSNKKTIPVVPRVVSACHNLFGQKSPKQRDEFFDKLVTGAMLDIGDPIYALRNRLYADKLESKKPLNKTTNEDDFTCFYMIIRAWNAYRSGERLYKIVVPTVEYGNKKITAPLLEIK